MSELMVTVLGALIAIQPTIVGTQEQPAAQPGANAPALTDPNAKTSYGYGLYLGRNLKMQSEQFKLDARLVARGIVDGISEAQPLLTEEELTQVMEELEEVLVARQMEAEQAMIEQNKEQAAQNKEQGDAFRAEYAQREGVKRTNSGLLYESLQEGQGASPTLSDTVTINYQGTLLDGTVFDSTEGKGPMTFPVAEFIEGWKQSLQLMKIGDKWRVVIPPELAYGEFGTPGGPIPPNATLSFEIELLGIAGQ